MGIASTGRFQPSWIFEKCRLSEGDSIFFPVSPSPESLLWFKRNGIRLFVNDPMPEKAILVNAIVRNQDELFSEENIKLLHAHTNRNPDFPGNPFRLWKTPNLNILQLDFLYFWREVTFSLSDIQMNLLAAAVKGVISYWLSFPVGTVQSTFSPTEILLYFIQRNNNMIFPGRGEIFSIQNEFSEISEEIESSLQIIILRDSSTVVAGLPSPDLLFHAWWMGSNNLSVLSTNISERYKPWSYSLQEGNSFTSCASKCGKSVKTAFCWSTCNIQTARSEEIINSQLKRALQNRYKNSSLHFKSAAQSPEEYDFLCIFN
ncbi:MAG: hypothetical protein HQM10_00625 [Candidatus Riflebacteria bacterium]|nr:hypothetical protein [Candidatus Riflebacteria bacterium]